MEVILKLHLRFGLIFDSFGQMSQKAQVLEMKSVCGE